ncbi:hypothetical protein [Mesobacillus zeae]|uniref:hypothetical protein n=1 Tax=Mesobacillus zeae TaxID=1917180 RepID=UPI003009AD00
MALKKLNAEHYLAIEYLSLPRKGGKSDIEIAEECCVTDRTIRNWKKDPLFERELKRQIVRNTVDRLPEIFEKIPDIIIKDGNAAMLKTLLQTHDMLTDRVEVQTADANKGVDLDEMRARLGRLKGGRDTGNE